MGHEAIKLELIEWLTKLEDEETIQYLKIVKENSISEQDRRAVLPLNVKKKIEKSQQDKIEGRLISHEEVVNSFKFYQK